MPLRFSCRPAMPPAGSPVSSHWPGGFHRPRLDVYLVGPGGVHTSCRVLVDTGADFNLFNDQAAFDLGLQLPFPRRTAISGAGGTRSSGVSFAPAGLVGLFVTDFVEYCYLPAPLVGFHDPSPGTMQRSVLGLTGFLQFFRFALDHGLSPPTFELHPTAAFPGQSGALPRDRPVADFLRQLRGP